MSEVTEVSRMKRWYAHQIKVLKAEIDSIEKRLESGRTLLTLADLELKKSQVRVYEIRLHTLETGEEL